MRRSKAAWIVVAVGAWLASGCAGKVNKEAMASIKKIGILSVSMDKVGTSPADHEVLRAAVDAATEQYAGNLKKSTRWEVVDLATYKANPAFQGLADASTSAIVRARLEAMAERGELTPSDPAMAMKYAFASAEEKKELAKESIGGTAQQLQGILQTHRERYIGATDLPLVPYSALKPDGGANKTVIKAGDAANDKNPEERVRDIMLESIGALAAELGLDAMAVVHVRHEIRATVGVGVIVGDRGMDTIRMDPTVMLIGKDGKVAIDMGYPSLDDMAPSKMAVPVYKKVAEHQTELDLKGDEKVLVEYTTLAKEVADSLAEDVEKELAAN